MPSQIFKNAYPIQGLFDFLEIYSDKRKKLLLFHKKPILRRPYLRKVLYLFVSHSENIIIYPNINI